MVAWITAEQSLFLGHAREVTIGRELAPGQPLAPELFADYPAVSGDPLADFLTVFDGQTLGSNLDIHGVLWSERVYLPLLARGWPYVVGLREVNIPVSERNRDACPG